VLEDVKVRKGVGVIVSEGVTDLAREALSGIYARRPLARVGSSSGAVMAMARTRRARRNAVFVRIIIWCKA
jgi:surfactin synthase thioesterase subunit